MGRETQGNCVFIAAIDRTNVEELRATILHKVQELYRIRYPYRDAFFDADGTSEQGLA